MLLSLGVLVFVITKTKIWGVLVLGVANGLSKMLSLGKFKPSLGISALKKSVSESRISKNYNSLGVSDFGNLDLGISDFENLNLEINFYPQAYLKREIKKILPLPVSAFTIVM